MLAAAHGKDLIRVKEYREVGKSVATAGCYIDDNMPLLLQWIESNLHTQGVRPSRAMECLEVRFTGGIKPHAVDFKSAFTAKYLFQRHPVRISLVRFGTAREGFPVFEWIMDEIKKHCQDLKAYHTFGWVQATYTEIFCFLHPST